MGNVVVFRRRVDVFPLDTASPLPFNRFRGTRFARRLATTSWKPDHDAYLLVLLADQEMIAGRDAEARSLLDAAYAAFDCRSNRRQGSMASG